MERSSDKQGPPLPMLWVISHQLARGHAKTYGLRGIKAWPRGFFMSAPGYGLGWISLKDLPVVRDTLLLRLMAVDKAVFGRAVKDLLALPEEAIERRAAMKILVAQRMEVGNNKNADGEQQEWAMNYNVLYETWEREKKLEGKVEGKIEGKIEGIQTSILDIYRTRFGVVPAELEDVVKHEMNAERLRMWCNLFVTESSEEIARILKP